MLLLLVLIVWSVEIKAFSLFNRHFSFLTRRNQYEDNDQFTGYKRSVSITGKVFVTMLGFPSKCERKGVRHACTLSFACWLVGGSSHPGCGGNLWIVACCVSDKNILPADTPYEEYIEIQRNMSSAKNPEQVLQKRIDDFSLENEILDAAVEENCGLSADRMFSKRIIGGKEAKFAQFPWQAYIKINTFQCGGALVSKKFVATAAHCIITAPLENIFVYLGELDTQDIGLVQEFAPANLHMTRQKIVHPQFRLRLTQPDRFDLALLELAPEATLDFHIFPICLPDRDLQLAGREAVVAGWGKVKKTNELTGTNVLRSTTVPILDMKDCILWHQFKKIYVDLHEEMLCAGYEDGKQDACLGDSGGPLIVQENGKWTLAGLISAGFGCGEAHQPGIYHKITSTSQWIRSVISQ